MSKKYRILVVDDSTETRDLVEDMLISIGHLPRLAKPFNEYLLEEKINQALHGGLRKGD